MWTLDFFILSVVGAILAYFSVLRNKATRHAAEVERGFWKPPLTCQDSHRRWQRRRKKANLVACRSRQELGEKSSFIARLMNFASFLLRARFPGFHYYESTDKRMDGKGSQGEAVVGGGRCCTCADRSFSLSLALWFSWWAAVGGNLATGRF